MQDKEYSPERSKGSRLELGKDAGGARYFLEGKPVPTGTPLELLMPEDQWLSGRFDWDPYSRDRRPELYIAIGGHEDAQAPIRLPPDAYLRRPKRK